MHQIKIDEITYHPSSIVDPNGRLFEWQGQLFRAIDAEHAPFYRSLFTKGVFDHLENKGLVIQTQIEPLSVEGFDIVLKHQKVPFVSYPYEWAGTMLRDAALLLLDLNGELADFGLTTQDAHPWNILFNGTKPVFVDVGSIIPLRSPNSWKPQWEFLRCFLRPLYLFSINENRLARLLMRDYAGVSEGDLAHIGRPTFGRAFRDLKQRATATFKDQVKNNEQLFRLAKMTRDLSRHGEPTGTPQSSSPIDQLRALRRRIENMDFPIQKTQWSDYYSRAPFPSLSDQTDWTAKNKSVFEIVNELNPTTVLDVASNRGWFSQMSAKHGSQVVALDNDEVAISMLYRDAKQRGDAIFPVVMDILNPSPGYGWIGRGWALPATDRLKCELVLALALVHHLVFKSTIPMKFAHIVDLLGSFAKKWLLVEFIPPEDSYVSSWVNEKYSWYTLDNFICALEKEFHVVRQLESYPAPRVILLCRRNGE
ncbi:MAG: class I SAM-dependent methyltransferase [Nitrospirae bacterium]|nr:class I SAM-dependent methyltransferase [Nitrospirota bacterium]